MFPLNFGAMDAFITPQCGCGEGRCEQRSSQEPLERKTMIPVNRLLLATGKDSIT